MSQFCFQKRLNAVLLFLPIIYLKTFNAYTIHWPTLMRKSILSFSLLISFNPIQVIHCKNHKTLIMLLSLFRKKIIFWNSPLKRCFCREAFVYTIFFLNLALMRKWPQAYEIKCTSWIQRLNSTGSLVCSMSRCNQIIIT